MIDYLIKHFLFTCLVNKSQPVPLLEKGGGACYIPCIEFYQYCVGFIFNCGLDSLTDLIMDVSAGKRGRVWSCKPCGYRGEKLSVTNHVYQRHLSLEDYPSLLSALPIHRFSEDQVCKTWEMVFGA